MMQQEMELDVKLTVSELLLDGTVLQEVLS